MHPAYQNYQECFDLAKCTCSENSIWNYSFYGAKYFLLSKSNQIEQLKGLKGWKGNGKREERRGISDPAASKRSKTTEITKINVIQPPLNPLFNVICVSLGAHITTISRKAVHGLRELVLSMCFTHTDPPCTHSTSNWLLEYMLLLFTRMCWDCLRLAGLQTCKRFLHTLINMLPTLSGTNSTFEIFLPHQRTDPVPDVGGVEITYDAHRKLILATQTL